MTTRIYASQLPQHIGESVTISGWLHRLRSLRSVSFLILRDCTGISQIVLEDPLLIEQIAALPVESILSVTGLVLAVEQATNGVEIHNPTVNIITIASAPPTFDLFRPEIKAQLPTLLDHRAVSLRHPTHRALWQIAAAAMAGFRQALTSLDFIEIQTPKIVSAATESGANVFEIDYFGRSAYLAQSPQFYKQMMVGVFERVFEVGPVFRAEPHSTTRHLTQYTSMDAEMGFIKDHFTVMQTLNRVLAAMMETIKEQAQSAISTLELSLPSVPDTIPHLHFADAHELYFQATGIDSRSEPDLDPAEERWLGAWAQREHHSDFLFVVGYPMQKRPFYTHPDAAHPQYSNSFDLLFRGLELVTGGQRLHEYSQYLGALEQFNINPEPIEGYLAAFKHGMPPHGGWAIGLERFVTQLTGRSNVREATLFPRDMQRLTP
jgi:nondiscriminating aspartyl-tRNA synthetase